MHVKVLLAVECLSSRGGGRGTGAMSGGDEVVVRTRLREVTGVIVTKLREATEAREMARL